MTQLPQRKSPRLNGYDYAQVGGYFITICTHNRQHIFGEITDATMKPSIIGHIASSIWFTIPRVFPSIALSDFVLMPNHIHSILMIEDSSEQAPTVGNVIGNYKGTVTREAKRLVDNVQIPLWQTRYHDHIIRNDDDFLRIREYVQNNVAQWADDTLNDD